MSSWVISIGLAELMSLTALNGLDELTEPGQLIDEVTFAALRPLRVKDFC